MYAVPSSEPAGGVLCPSPCGRGEGDMGQIIQDEEGMKWESRIRRWLTWRWRASVYLRRRSSRRMGEILGYGCAVVEINLHY